MIEKKTCPTHHLELVFHAEGISKGGNRFNAFLACPKGKKDCGYTENIEEKQGHFLSMQAEFRRSKEIAYFSCTNAAVEVVAFLYPDLSKVGMVEKIPSLIQHHRDWFLAEWENWYKKNIMEQE